MGMPILARDLLMLMCQDENRNLSRKLNAAKKERGEVVKLGRRKISEGTQCLAFLTIGVGKTLSSSSSSSSSATLTPDKFQSHRQATQQLPRTQPSQGSSPTAPCHVLPPCPPLPAVTRPTSLQRPENSDPTPSEHIPSKSTATKSTPAKRTRRPSAALCESAVSQRMQKRRCQV